MGWNVAGANLSLTMLMMAGSPAFAEVSPATGKPLQTAGSVTALKQASIPISPLVPVNFNVPTHIETANFRLVPLGPEEVTMDFDAYMSSIEHLQQTFSRSTRWPHKDISQSEAMADMLAEQARFKNRQSFAYSVLAPDGKRERGCVYVSPSTVAGYDAVVRLWVTKEEYDAGFDAELYRWVANWIRADWPFAKVAYPGRAIGWSTWDPMVAAAKAKEAAGEKRKL